VELNLKPVATTQMDIEDLEVAADVGRVVDRGVARRVKAPRPTDDAPVANNPDDVRSASAETPWH
jgi:hypothetical protein